MTDKELEELFHSRYGDDEELEKIFMNRYSGRYDDPYGYKKNAKADSLMWILVFGVVLTLAGMLVGLVAHDLYQVSGKIAVLFMAPGGVVMVIAVFVQMIFQLRNP